jgi:hypothetical protein
MIWAAHLIGAFYIFAGIIGLRAMAMDRLLDAALLAMSPGKPPDRNERIKSLCLTYGAALTLASGVALLILSSLAPGLFVANLAVQTFYLIWAERAIPPEEAADRLGRTRTINAALIYAAATVFAVWAGPEYARSVFAIGPLPSLAVEFAIILFATGGAYFYFIGRTRLRLGGSDDRGDDSHDESYDDDTEFLDDLSDRPKALRVMPERDCSPVWDDFTGRNIALDELYLSGPLRERIERWRDAYAAAQPAEDHPDRGFKDEAALEAFFAEGEAIVEELRKEWGGTVVSNIRREW